MPEEDIVEVKIELAKMQTELKNHTNSSVDFRADMKDMLVLIQGDIKKMNDGIYKRRKQCFEDSKAYTNARVLWAIGIPTTIFALFKIFEAFGG